MLGDLGSPPPLGVSLKVHPFCGGDRGPLGGLFPKNKLGDAIATNSCLGRGIRGEEGALITPLNPVSLPVQYLVKKSLAFFPEKRNTCLFETACLIILIS